jgi:hypothetical protein
MNYCEKIIDFETLQDGSVSNVPILCNGEIITTKKDNKKCLNCMIIELSILSIGFQMLGIIKRKNIKYINVKEQQKAHIYNNF